ncbi:MAG TPA: hypothetical protein VMS76_17455 [Planctomycetota bacterium]|nr:hypothetical protein [Planctomycetota bacterium]
MRDREQVRRLAAGAMVLALSLSAATQDGARSDGRDGPPEPDVPSVWDYLKGRHDKDGDGRITRAEYERDDAHFARLDTDGNGVIELSDLEGRARGRPGYDETRPPGAGDEAPDFALEVLEATPDGVGAAEGFLAGGLGGKDGGSRSKEPERVRLSSFRGKRPVALIFGSYT